MKKAKKSADSILVIADTQFPYEHQDYLAFCKAVARKYKTGRVIHIGDIADALNFSRYERDPSMPNVDQEVFSLNLTFQQWAKVFPEVECVVGNHDRRIRQRLDTAGFSDSLIPMEVIFREVLGLPKKWTMHDEVLYEGPNGPILFLHGDEKGNSIVPGNALRTMGCSLVTGHNHSVCFVWALKTLAGTRYHMSVGSGIDDEAIAFKYNRKDMRRPILACGVVINGVPRPVMMTLDKDGRWNGEVG